MRFLLDPEQRAFAHSLNALLTAADTPAVIRGWAAGDHTAGRALWSRLADAGVFALAVPEAYEGVGPLPVELAVAFVELGRHGVPGPLVETVAAAALLSRLDESGPAKRLLPALASGAALATVALPGGGPFVLDADAAEVCLTVTYPGAGRGEHPAGRDAGVRGSGTRDTARDVGRVDPGISDTGPRDAGARGTGTRDAGTQGTETRDAGVPDTSRPDTSTQNTGTGPPDTSAAPAQLHLTQTPHPHPHPHDSGTGTGTGTGSSPTTPITPGVDAPAPRPSLDRARRLTLPRPGGELLAAGPHVTRAAAQALTWARLATAAQALGVGLALLDMTVEYVKRRTQFGVPIGSFQAVKHQLADAKVALEFARPLLFGAALSMDPADVAAAKVTACEAAYATARTALQAHGAIGYTAEYDLSLWLTKSRALHTAWGSPAECRAEVLAGRTAAGGGDPRP
ncbi:acyl-CoA dehydrogenase family protein [Streptomyces sp. NPDC050535]|uniref:acyl-CoA dehydrogenase family protein n=1 Tax=Streptomyces sp. NPDC050535 TaxID=3365626 RepID=UPI00378A49AF